MSFPLLQPCFAHTRVLRQPCSDPVPGEHLSLLGEQLAVTCFVLSLPCQHFYATRISFSTFLSLTCLYFLCFLFCAGGRRTRFLCETAAVVNDGDKPAKTEGREYSEGTPGHVQMSFPTHHQQRALQSSVFLSLCPLPFPTMSFSSPLTFLSLAVSPLLAGRHPGKCPQDLSQRRARSPLPSLSSHACLRARCAQILTFLLSWRWPAAPGGLARHRFAPALHVVLQRHDDFLEFWLLLDKLDLVHLFGREAQPRDERGCGSGSVKIISARARAGSLPKGSGGSLWSSRPGVVCTGADFAHTSREALKQASLDVTACFPRS